MDIFNEDCMDGMKRFEDNYFDLAMKRIKEQTAQLQMEFS